MADFVYVCLGAAIGAPARYLVDRLVQVRHESLMPWGTWTVNVVGSLILGLVVGLGGVPPAVLLAVGTGFCGTLTTYSTFCYETMRLLEAGRWRTAATNVGLTLSVGLAAFVVGFGIGGWW